MIPQECKRLAEVDFPIAVVSKHAVREKSIRSGHPSTLHLWWARRPLASSRAVLMALLLPDPCDEHCPEGFKSRARELLAEFGGKTTSSADLRATLLRFIAEFASWDNAAEPVYLRIGRSLVTAAHGEERPLVVDPFSGGGSIPLEALRLDCEAFATDLNPVALMILKVMLEDIPRHGPELAEELRRLGGEIKATAAKELADLYPTDADGSTPIVYLWARTVRCESPNCGAEIPLVRSMWLCRKANRRRALRSTIVREDGEPPHVQLEVFEPADRSEVSDGTVAAAKASCICCGTVLHPDRLRDQLAAARGGGTTIYDGKGERIGGARMTAVVTLRAGEKGRHYRNPRKADYDAVRLAQNRVERVLADWNASGMPGLCPVPDEPMPTTSGGFMAPPRYGMTRWGDLFTSRQIATLLSFSEATASVETSKQVLALVLTRLVNAGCSLCRWDVTRESHQGAYSDKHLPMVMDYSEANPLTQSTGSYSMALQWVSKVVESWPSSRCAQVQYGKAADHPLPDQTANVWFTDPPYYFAVPYADISDFFFVWLKRVLPGHPLLTDPSDSKNRLTPKKAELCEMKHWDAVRYPEKDKQFFEDGMASAFSEGRRILREDGIGTVVFAHKTTEGWEALLSGLIRGGWSITGSWPIATESRSRLRAKDSAALATSVHLVIRPRSEAAAIGDWAEVLCELPECVTVWMERLQGEGIRGADLVFACIGPALEVFSRYRSVETAEGREVSLAEYLGKVWEVVGRVALERVLGNADASILEEDARLVALFLWTLQGTDSPADNVDREDEAQTIAKTAAKGFSLPFDVVRRVAQPMGIDLDVWTDRVIAQSKGIVRLLPVSERARALFGEDGASAAADWIESDPNVNLQGVLFPEVESAPKKKRRGRKALVGDDAELQSPDATTLDRVHAAMLLQASGQAHALRKLLAAEQDRGPNFLRLANALSALYPHGAEEKRLLDAMLLAVPK